MKYETPEVMASTLAIEAIQHAKAQGPDEGPPGSKDTASAYEDWEE